jgi:hypothetical protein
MRWAVVTWWGIVVCAMSLSACQTPPERDCGAEVTFYQAETRKYLQCLEDKGNLRHQLKTCQEKR